jgi:hypothetical protein
MKRKLLLSCIRIGCCWLMMIGAFNPGQPARAAEVPSYLNPNLPLDTRVRDLLSRMTLDEKIGQMTQADLGRWRTPRMFKNTPWAPCSAAEIPNR